MYGLSGMSCSECLLEVGNDVDGLGGVKGGDIWIGNFVVVDDVLG